MSVGLNSTLPLDACFTETNFSIEFGEERLIMEGRAVSFTIGKFDDIQSNGLMGPSPY